SLYAKAMESGIEKEVAIGFHVKPFDNRTVRPGYISLSLEGGRPLPPSFFHNRLQRDQKHDILKKEASCYRDLPDEHATLLDFIY
ncbi:MAG: hypothetical protein KAH23_08590, partial [Kiritimatiellae bacterium]|nr:hypothetical protein [Kiritimatiellia bacterium]